MKKIKVNSIKSLANMSNTKIVLFGTYDLNTVFNLDGQLSRRVKEVHFPRYDYNKENDRKNFRAVLLTFQKLLPIEVEPNLIDHSDFIYENCIGCTGILKNWLQRCLTFALESREYIKNELKESNTKSSMYINENSIITLDYVNAIEKLTGRNDIINLTLLNWSAIFSNNIRSKYKRWCPICLSEMAANPEKIYEP